jgi:hypothetical protein
MLFYACRLYRLSTSALCFLTQPPPHILFIKKKYTFFSLFDLIREQQLIVFSLSPSSRMNARKKFTRRYQLVTVRYEDPAFFDFLQGFRTKFWQGFRKKKMQGFRIVFTGLSYRFWQGFRIDFDRVFVSFLQGPPIGLTGLSYQFWQGIRTTSTEPS